MKKVLPFLSLFALLACDEYELTRNNGLIGKWRLHSEYSDPGDGSGRWYRTKLKRADVIEFRADSTFHVLDVPQSGSSFSPVDGQRFTIRGDRLFFYVTVPQTGPGEGIGVNVEAKRLELNFFCDEYCAARYVAVQ